MFVLWRKREKESEENGKRAEKRKLNNAVFDIYIRTLLLVAR